MRQVSLKSVKLAVAMVAVVGLSACQAKKQLDNMHDATMDMRDQTQHLGRTSDELGRQMGEMYDALRQGDSLKARRDSLNAMVSARDSARKVSEAGKYFMSFEYQIWSAIGEDTPVRRVEAAESAMKEFMKDVQEFLLPGQTEVDPFATRDSETGNRQMNFNSLAAALHMVNPKQTVMRERQPGVAEMTMYSMLREAVASKAKMDRGEIRATDLPGYVREALNYPRVLELLLQARYNYVGAMAVARVSKLREGTLPYLRMRFMSWDLDLSKLNVVEMREVARYFRAATTAHDVMKEAGLTPKLNHALGRVLGNMRVRRVEAPSATPSVGSDREAARAVAVSEMMEAQTELLMHVETYRATGGAGVRPMTEEERVEAERQAEALARSMPLGA